jgi:hypothetical protein
VDGNTLCVDLNEPDKETRIARKVPLDLEPTLSGTLFNGFTRTKHADVLIVKSDHEKVQEKTILGETYKKGQYGSMDSQGFWAKVWEL